MKASLVATAIASLPLGAQAAGLGGINVQSHLGQPLQAEIQLNATPQELQSLVAHVAPTEAFQQANVPYAPFMSSVKVTVDKRGGKPILKLTSGRPIEEPLVSLLIELAWEDGRMSRAYNFLLDPVDVVLNPRVLPINAPSRVAETTAPTGPTPVQPSSGPETTQVPSSTTSPPPASFAGTTSPAGTYTVRPGDTLTKVAKTHLPPGVELDQLLIALYRANQSAFIDNNLHLIRRDSVLQVPSAEQARAIDLREARREIKLQTANFNQMRTTIARQAPSSQPGGDPTTGEVRRHDPPKAPTKPIDVLKVEADAERMKQLEIDLVTSNNALKESQSRIADLEKLNADLQELIKLQAAKPAVEPAAPPSAPQQQPEVPTEQPVPPTTDQTVVDQPSPPIVKAPPPPPRTTPPPTPPTHEPDLLDTLTDPVVLGSVGGLVALLGGFFGFRAWQRKREEASLTSLAQASSMFPDETSDSLVFSGDNGGQSVDTTGSSSVIHTDFSQVGVVDTNEGVDPVAEADVYMAYGRDTQAEEILNDALKANPDRGAIYVKLLEIYAQRQNLKQFETTASELFARTRGQGRDWERAAQLGRKLDPSNPVYGATERSSGDVATSPPAKGLDLGKDSGPSLSSLDFTASVPSPGTGQLEETLSIQNGLSSLLATRVGKSEEDDIPLLPDESQVAAEAAAVDLGASDEDIDFDLGGDTITPPEPVAATAAQNSMTNTGLDFDLGIDDSDDVAATPPPQPVSRPPVVVAATPPDASASSLEFELPELGQAEGEKPGFDMSATVILPPGEGSDGEAMLDLERSSFDPGVLDFDLDIDNDNDGVSVGTTAANTESGGDVAVAESESDTDTKLDLARAYQDMGDVEGALELLREVVAEGSSVQKASAQELIDQLS
ncbi:MAG: hypothetical protein LBB76_12320 [Azoarcus sp.]|nr:hypothetical protein [Azoarcus sp.]